MALVRIVTIGAVVAGVQWFALDSGMMTAEVAPRFYSAALAGLGTIFGAGSAVMYLGGQPDRAPQYAGMALGVLGYALARLTFVP